MKIFITSLRLLLLAAPLAAFFSLSVFAQSKFAIIEVQNPFEDIKSHWAENFVFDLFKRGIVSGYDETNFGPDREITRAELTKIALEAFVIEEPITLTSETGFADVDSDDWFSDYVLFARDLEIIDGYNDNTFRPNQPVTRAEAVKILLNASAKVSVDTLLPTGEQFDDVNSDDWYAGYVNYAYQESVIGGYNAENGKLYFSPNQPITRAEVAKVTSQLLK